MSVARRALEENEDDEHDEPEREKEGRPDLGDRVADEGGGVVGDFELHPLRHERSELRQGGLDRVGDLERRGARLLDDSETHGGQLVVTDDRPLVLGADRDLCHVREPDGAVADLREEDRAELGGIVELAARAHGELAAFPLDATGRDLGVLPLDRAVHVDDSEPVGREPGGIEPYAHRIPALAADDDGPDAGEPEQPLLQDDGRDVRDFEVREAFSIEREPHDRLRVRVDLRDDRVLGLPRQLSPQSRHAVAHVVGGLVHVARKHELDRDPGDLLLARTSGGASRLRASRAPPR